MKKIFLLSLSICLLSYMLGGCKKNAPAAPSVIGYWTGIIEAFPVTNGFGMLIIKNGTIKIYISSGSSVDTTTITNTAVGPYTFTDTTFTATTTAQNGAVITFNGVYSKSNPVSPGSGPFLSGTWNQMNSGGSFGINKVN